MHIGASVRMALCILCEQMWGAGVCGCRCVGTVVGTSVCKRAGVYRTGEYEGRCLKTCLVCVCVRVCMPHRQTEKPQRLLSYLPFKPVPLNSVQLC